MTAELIKGQPYSEPPEPHHVAPVETATLTPNEHERRMELRDNLYSYLKGVMDVDPHTTNPNDEPRLAEGVHKFITGPVHSKAQQILEARRKHDELLQVSPPSALVNVPEPPKKIFTVPFDPVRQRRERFYKQYGVGRRNRIDELREPQEEYISQAKRAIYVDTFERHGPDGRVVRVARYTQYPEIGIALQIRDIVHDDSTTYLTDACDVLLAAYGKRFQEMAHYSGLTIVRDNPRVQHIDQTAIPEEARAEDWHKRQ